MSDTATIAPPRRTPSGTVTGRAAMKNRIARIKGDLEKIFTETRLPHADTVEILTDIKQEVDGMLEMLNLGKERHS